MPFVFYNPNPLQNTVGDCVIRGISILMGRDWDSTYLDIAMKGLMMKDMPSSNKVWGSYLSSKGYRREVIPNTCPDCYTVEDFAYDHPKGKYLLATGSHVVAVVDGNYYDTWNSGGEVPIYFWVKETKDEPVSQTSRADDADVQQPVLPAESIFGEPVSMGQANPDSAVK